MSENTNLGLTVQAWADIVIDRWEQKILDLKITDTFDLFKSFVAEVKRNAGDNPERIVFAFNYYGRFVDMGVGNGIPAKEVNIKNARRPKTWYSKIFYSQCKKLSVILAEKYAKKANLMIIEAISDREIV